MKKSCFGIMALAIIFVVVFALKPAMSETLVLRLAIPSVKTVGAMETTWLTHWITQMEKRTNGRVKIQPYWGGSLVQIKEMAEAIKTGLADISWTSESFHQGYATLTGVPPAAMPFSPNMSAVDVIKKWYKILDRVPEVYEEQKKTNMVPLIQRYYDHYWLWSNKPVRQLADLAGLKIRNVGESQVVAFRSVDATPMFLSTPETYQGLQQKILDAAATAPDTGDRYKLQEVVKYITKINLSYGWAQWCMNLNTWNKLTPADQKTMMELGKETAIMIGDLVEKGRVVLEAAFKKKGVEFLPFPEKDREEWSRKPELIAFADKWAAEEEARGLPGRKIMQVYREIMK